MPAVKKSKMKRGDCDSGGEAPKPSKEECAIIKFLLSNLPHKEGKLSTMNVKIFIGSDAVDAILSEKFAKSGLSSKFGIAFRNACDVTLYLNILLQKRIFHRAARVLKKQAINNGTIGSEKKPKKMLPITSGNQDDTVTSVRKRPSGKGNAADESATENKDSASNQIVVAAPEKDSSTFSSKKKSSNANRKIKLTMHADQMFFNSDDVYVWVYEPTSVKNIIFGTLIIIFTIACCLFPLWPTQMRSGAYYASLSAIGLVGCLLGVALIRLILFGMLWGVSFGKLHFWLFPNFSEDCGFFDSFKPLYALNAPTKKKKSDKISSSETTQTSESKSSSENKSIESKSSSPKTISKTEEITFEDTQQDDALSLSESKRDV